jgi:hypothetical protein
MITDLFFILALRVHDKFWEEIQKNISEQLVSECEFGPVVSLLQDLQNVAFDTSLIQWDIPQQTKLISPLKSILPSKYAS